MLRIEGSLNKAICNNDHNAFLSELKQSPKQINQKDRRGRTSLQLASILGNFKAVLQLLYEGVDPDSPYQLTPFYLSLDYGQMIVSHILHYAGADKERALAIAKKNNRMELQNKITKFSFDDEIFAAMVFWVISQEKEDKIIALLNKMFASMPNTDMSEVKLNSTKIFFEEKKPTHSLKNIGEFIGGIIEFSAYKKHFKVAKILANKFSIMPRAETHSATFGFWSVMHQRRKKHNLININEGHDFLTLAQLRENHFTDIPDYLTYLSNSHNNTHITQQFSDEKINLNATKIFGSAKYSKTNLLEVSQAADIIPSDFLEAITFSYQKNNYVALFCLLRLQCKFNLFQLLSKSSDKNLLLMYFFLNKFHKKSEFEDVISARENLEHTNDGIINASIYLGLNGLVDSRTEEEINLQNQYFKTRNVSLNDWIHRYFKIMWHRNDIHSKEDIIEKIPSVQWKPLMRHANRFRFELVLEDKKNDCHQSIERKVLETSVILNSIRAFLTVNENARLNEVSNLFLVRFPQTLSEEINGFLLLLNRELAKKSSFYNAETFLTVGLVIMLLIAMSLSLKKTYQTRAWEETIFDEFYSSNSTDGTPCSSALSDGRSSEKCNMNTVATQPPCYSLCSDLGNSPSLWFLLADFFLPVMAAAIVAALFYKRSKDSADKDSKSIRSYPLLGDQAQRLFSKVNNYFDSKPELDSKLQLDSKLDLDSKIQTVKQRLKHCLAHLSLFNKPKTETDSKETIIDVKRMPTNG